MSPGLGTALLAGLGLTVAGGLAAGGVVAAHRLTAPLPAAKVAVAVPRSIAVAPGTAPPIPAPATGSFALVDDAGGLLAAAAPDTPRPIASVAKTMTALVVLQADPLTPGAAGPILTMNANDVALYRETIAEQGSAVPVSAGEQLSERDLLLALMLPSANNIAETLALRVSGSRDAFIAGLNAEASALGMASTHFADPSGYNPATVSTPGDLVKLARASLAVPALAAVVATRSATLPDGTALANLDVLLGSSPGWLGIKTGWTPQAGGCLLFAVQHVYATGVAPVTVYGAVLGQPANTAADAGHPELGGAFEEAQRAATAAFSGYAAVDLATVPLHVTGTVSTPWEKSAGIAVRGTRGVIVVRLGSVLAAHPVLTSVGATPRAGVTAGRLLATLGSRTVASWRLETTSAIDPPQWWWRLLHE